MIGWNATTTAMTATPGHRRLRHRLMLLSDVALVALVFAAQRISAIPESDRSTT